MATRAYCLFVCCTWLCDLFLLAVILVAAVGVWSENVEDDEPNQPGVDLTSGVKLLI